jgi:HAD superfamily hydrolase (TIGR01549 family)
MSIHAITFDFWDTLYEFPYSTWDETLDLLSRLLAECGHPGFEHDQLSALTVEINRQWDTVWRDEQRTFGAQEWLERFLKSIHLTPDPKILGAYIDDMENGARAMRAIAIPGGKELLERLSKHYRLGLISDVAKTPGRTLRRVMQRDGLAPYFTHLTFSDEAGRSKPHYLPFQLTLQALGVSPQQAVHVGDLRRTDIAGARNAGMRSIRFAGANDDTNPDHPEADSVAQSYTELETIIAQMDTD